MTTEVNQPAGTPPAGTPRTQAVIEAELASIESNTSFFTQGDDQADAQADAAEAAKLRSSGETSEANALDAATRRGWVPRDQYKGEPGKWVDAKTFLDRGDRFASNLQRENAELRKTISSFQGTQKAFKTYMEGVVEQKQTQLNGVIEQLRLQRSAAIREGDDSEALALEDRIDLLREEKKKVAKIPSDEEGQTPADDKAFTSVPVPPPNDPVIEEWIEDGNAWFRDDPTLMKYSVALGQRLIADGETVKGRRFLDKISGLMRQEFPRKFRKFDEAAGVAPINTPRSPIDPTPTRNTGNPAATSGKSERDLPAEDLALMKQFVKEGWVTKEKFLADYFSR